MQLSFDPYATLGVGRNADARQIRSAYRRLAREHHPDLSGDSTTTERMQRINQAWEVLSNPARRAQYDAGVTPAPAPSTGHWAPPRRAAQWAPPPRAWSAETAASAGYRPSPSVYDDDEGWSWGRIGIVAVLVLVVAPLLFAGVPVPFFGLFLLLAAGWASPRDRR
jgi:curved DNA-binding protein CbpA